MSDYNETVPITAEARGLARALHNRVIASDLAYDKARQLIFKPLYERLRRKPTVRSEMALEILRAFRAIDTPFRLGDVYTEPRSKGHLFLGDILITAAVAQGGWSDASYWENNICISLVNLTAGSGDLRMTNDIIITVSMHAIARWYQRTGLRDDARLITDLEALFVSGVAANASSPTDDIRVPVPGGAWLGRFGALNPVSNPYLPVPDEPPDAHWAVGRGYRPRWPTPSGG
jgi:hypothetical protein